MITITEKGILIEMPGMSCSSEDVEMLNVELIDVLQIATMAEDKGYNYYWLFQLLKAIQPNLAQLQLVHPFSSYQLKSLKDKKI
ncbi:hypothetical protein [Pedobacter nototheniae]|uniref:hypothetical protein n=1 Tax=Pedobacter nototheniae TaxID=2488994 RepID=UPI00103B68C9|nr:hypothetical protein [Pedobacter nototheniae]